MFEKHVGLPTTQYPINAYSANPQQVERWLQAAQRALLLCGEGAQRLPENPVERTSLRGLQRGVFARRPIAAGETVRAEDVYFAFPPQDGQYTASDWSKYAHFTAHTAIAADTALTPANTKLHDMRAKVWDIVQRVRAQLAASHVVVPARGFGNFCTITALERFDEMGLTMLTVINRSYCKKLLMLLPGQRHPEQHHKQKEETFHVLHGSLTLSLDGVERFAVRATL